MFRMADPPGVRDLPPAMPCALVNIRCFLGYGDSCTCFRGPREVLVVVVSRSQRYMQCYRRASSMIQMASMAVQPTSPAGLQGGPQKLVVPLTDVVSCSSTDPTMWQAVVYFTKVQSHIRGHL